MSDDGRPVTGSICHHEIPAPDLAAQQEFYGSVFGWEFAPMSDEYVLFRDGLTGGGLDAKAVVGGGGAVCVIAVDDVDEALEKIVAAGGSRLTEKRPCGESDEWGYYAYFADPCGNRMGVWART